MKTIQFAICTFFCVFTMISRAQNIHGIVVDIDDEAIVGANIVDQYKNLITVSDSKGHFNINLGQSKIFGVEKSAYQSRWFNLKDKVRDTMLVVLSYKYQEFEDVIVSAQSSQDALDLYDVNILDYRPFYSSILTLKREKGIYYVGIDSIGLAGPKYPFDYEKPRYLFEDCLGNMHVVCNDKVYQFAISLDTFIIIDIITKDKFQTYLEPCIAKFENGFVLKQLSLNNQLYDLALYEEGKEKQIFYRQIDPITSQISAENALGLQLALNEEILGDSINQNILTTRRYLRELYKGANPDVYLEFLKKNMSNRWEQRVTDYMLFSYPINVRSFQIRDFVAVVDFEVDSVSIYNKKGAFIQSRHFKHSEDIKDVWQDKSDGELYLLTRNYGTHYVFSLDVITGETKYVSTLRNIPFSKSEKVYDGWLYYREIENGFYGIRRLRIGS